MVDGSKNLAGIILASGLAGVFTMCVLYAKASQTQLTQIYTYNDGKITYKFNNKYGYIKF
jgi:hypothetical protein